MDRKRNDVYNKGPTFFEKNFAENCVQGQSGNTDTFNTYFQ